MDTKNLFFKIPIGSHSAGTKVPADFDQTYLARLFAKGYVIEVLPVDLSTLSAGEELPSKPVIESRWRYTDAELAELDLDMLNMLVVDHAERFNREVPPPFTDRAAAVAFLGSEA